MNRTTRLIGLGLLVSACAVAFAIADPMTIKYVPKEGDVHKYKMSGEVQVMGNSATITADFEYKVSKVDADGSYTTVSSQKNMQIEVAGQTINPPDESNTTVSKANGEIADVQTAADDTNAWRMAELTNFVYPDKPVNVGDEWTQTVAADAKKGTVAATATYKVDGLEKLGDVDTVRIKVSYKETEGSDPASNESTVWLDAKDYSMVKQQATWTNVPTPQGPINATINMERTS